jgi:hypothetical protein
MKIKVPFHLPTADLKKSESKMLNVEMKIPDSMEVSGDIEYSVVIPDYMFDELADTEDQFKTKYDVNNRADRISGLFSYRVLQRKFQKTQNAKLISQLQDYINGLTQFINDRHSVETATMTKKIFISFKHWNNHTRNDLNYAYTGRNISQNFQYFTGYEVMTDKFGGIDRKVTKRYISKIHYTPEGSSTRKLDTGFKEKDDLFLPLPNLNESIESFEGRYSIIDWTEEREDFCKKIQDTFLRVNKELEDFLKNIDNKKIDALMSGSGLKFLNA